MKNEFITSPDQQKPQDQPSTDWYRAATLAERAALLPKTQQRSETLTSNPSLREQALDRLQRWKEQSLFPDGSYFEARLALDALTEENLLTLLSESSDAIQARYKVAPDWLQELRAIFATVAENSGNLGLSLASSDNAGRQAVAFIEPFLPLIQATLLNVQQGVQRLVQRYTRLPFDPETVTALYASNLPQVLLPKVSRTLVLEMHVARIQGRLQGQTPEERFQSFPLLLSQPAELRKLLEEYAVLARILIERLKSWESNVLELLGRLCADWEQIEATFALGNATGTLVEIQEGAGDVHRGGQSVHILRWSSGFQLVYKPRNLSIDLHFQELLGWLNSCGLQPELRPLKIIQRERYGWVEYVQAQPCASRAEVERFYQRQGAYLALLYVVEATDFHAENVVAAGEHPMLIDLETLFLPQYAGRTSLQSESPGIDLIGHSVLAVGLLPQRLWSNNEGEGIDISGLGNSAGQLTPMPVSTWQGSGTDDMRITQARLALAANNNRPVLEGVEINALDFSESLVQGFSATYHLLMRQRQAFQKEILPRFADDEVRCVLRPTKTYLQLLADSYHPNALRDALDRDRLLDRLWGWVERLPHLTRLIQAEQYDLRNGDVPIFTTSPGSQDLVTSQGQFIPAFFDTTGLELVQKHIQELNEQDLEKQTWIIRASFTSLTLGTDRRMQSHLDLRPSSKPVNRERLLTAAKRVGERLRQLAIYQGEAVGWLGVTPLNEREWHLLPAESDLYSGTSGIVLFLAYLGAATDEESYTLLARSGLKTIRTQLSRQKLLPAAGGLGAYNGLGSAIYLLSHLGTIWNEPALYQEAEELTSLLPTALRLDGLYDVIGGAAGCCAVLLSLYAVAPTPSTLELALACGDHLLAHAQPQQQGIGWTTPTQAVPLSGLAHGNAGIALNLLRLAEVSGELRFRETALAALEYERSLFSPERQNWLDLRSNLEQPAKSGSEQVDMIAWCHGAPGIGLARLATLSTLDDPMIRTEIISALQTTLAKGFGTNHSLCHGDFGNLDILLSTSCHPSYKQYQTTVQEVTAMLLDNLETQGWVTGVPLGVETPGLMTGLAGIGYALLRLANPDQVPSVLLLDPPPISHTR